jgi:hypothetical protein
VIAQAGYPEIGPKAEPANSALMYYGGDAEAAVVI